MRLVRVLSWFVLAAAAAGCQPAPSVEAPAATPAAPAFTPAPHGTLAEVMRGIPFPNSNIIFDTQTNDPGAPKTAADSKGGAAAATTTYASTYGGWQQVENAAVALAETATLAMVPGRKCENGLDVPLGDATYQKGVQGLIDAGNAAYKAAKSKNLDAMVEVSGTISDACLACHEKYRDVAQGKMRCVPIP
jgi:soluble cytochrome b562